MVVLYEFQINSELGQGGAPVALREKASLVAVDYWFEQNRALQIRLQPVHGGGM
jgi:hypothetical protein